MKKEFIYSDENGGQYGVHDGFFNAIVSIDDKKMHIQCCCENDKKPAWDKDNAGITWGISGDVNKEIYEHFDSDWNPVISLIKECYTDYDNRED